jgi:hypothetical protein
MPFKISSVPATVTYRISLGTGQVARSCNHDNEQLCSKKGGNLLNS